MVLMKLGMLLRAAVVTLVIGVSCVVSRRASAIEPSDAGTDIASYNAALVVSIHHGLHRAALLRRAPPLFAFTSSKARIFQRLSASNRP